MTDTSSPIVPDLAPEITLATEFDMSRRTLARYRAAGMPYAIIGGKIFIHRAGARDWLLSHKTVGLPKAKPTKKRGR